MDKEKQTDRVQKIPITELIPFKDHPFKVVEDESMLRTTESISMFGVLTPLIARPAEDGRFEIISGHRRAHAAAAVGLTEVPVIVRDMDDDVAKILVVDSNLQRENILPSERAFAYKMKMEAMTHQGQRTDLLERETSTQLVPRLRSNEVIGAQNNQSRETVRRFIRLKAGGTKEPDRSHGFHTGGSLPLSGDASQKTQPGRRMQTGRYV